VISVGTCWRFGQLVLDAALGDKQEQAGRDALGGVVARWGLDAAGFEDWFQGRAQKGGMLGGQDLGQPSGRWSDALDHPAMLADGGPNRHDC
jgi:hypothetical protein